jgi:hypothetical protein
MFTGPKELASVLTLKSTASKIYSKIPAMIRRILNIVSNRSMNYIYTLATVMVQEAISASYVPFLARTFSWFE